MVGCCCSVVFLSLNILCVIVFQTTAAHFVHKCDTSFAVANKSIHSIKHTRENILHFYEQLVNHRNDSRHHRIKRYDVTTFRGHPKTREERWHVNFKLNATNLEVEQTQSLVILLNRVVDKYLNSCIPIILYDKVVERSDGIVLRTFFQVCLPFIFLFSHSQSHAIFRVSKYHIYTEKSMRTTQSIIAICCNRAIKDVEAIFYLYRMWCVHAKYWVHKPIIELF